MAAAIGNTVDTNLFEQISMNSEVQEDPKVEATPSHAFVAKCLHPPSAIANFEGLPTNDARTQVCVEWKDLRTTTTPGYGDGTSGIIDIVPNSVTGYAFLVVSGIILPFIAFVRANIGGVNTWYQDVRNTQPISVYNWRNFHLDANKYRPAYRSLTTYLNATMFNNVGLVASSQFNPAVMFAGNILTLLENHLTKAHKMLPRLIADGVVKRISINDPDYDDAIIQTLRLPPHVRSVLSEHCGPKEALSIDPNMSIQVVNLSSGNPQLAIGSTAVVPTVSQIMNFSARSYGGKAFEGTFNVSRLNSTAPQWLTASNTDSTVGNNRGLYLCYYWIVYPDGSEHFVPFSWTNDLAPGYSTVVDTLWSTDMTWSWVVYEGLAPNTLLENGTAELIIAKSYIGFEVQPSPRSAWAGLQRLGPKPDLAAMQALMDGFYELKDSMPARYNFWGTLGAIASKGLKTFGSAMLKELVSGDKKRTAKKAVKAAKPKQKPQQPKPTKQVAKIRNDAVKAEHDLDDLIARFEKLVSRPMAPPNQQQTSAKKGRNRSKKNKNKAV
jgi:hypothetical protein